tara:strand:+ start:658 stop:1134 length:477 start_codon:yes stop_codon:yes gene_type:complete
MKENKDLDGTLVTNPGPVFHERRQEAWKSSKIDELGKSLAIAQSKMKGAKKNSVNPFFNSNYADLHTVIESSLPYLNAQGLSVIQGNDTDENGSFYVTTMLLHHSGQWIKSKLKMPITKPDAQGVGATITYARRFALSAMIGIAQTDDDGNSIQLTDK